MSSRARMIGLTATALAMLATGQLAATAQAEVPSFCSPVSYGSAPGDYRTAQTFTVPPNLAGTELAGAQFRITKEAGTSGDWIIQVLAVDAGGTPTNTVLRSATISDLNVPEGGPQWLDASFAAMPWAPGEMYAIALTRPTASSYLYLRCDADTVPDGGPYRSTSQTGTWSSIGTTDLSAEIFVVRTGGSGVPPPDGAQPGSDPDSDSDDSGACERAKAKLRKAKEKLKDADTPDEKAAAKAKVKKAKKKKRKACG